MATKNNIVKRRPKQLNFGSHYIVYYNYNNKMTCKFIQPTRCGFNFLDLNTNKCILKQHLYPSKCENHLSEDWFWINEYLNIERIDNKFFIFNDMKWTFKEGL